MNKKFNKAMRFILEHVNVGEPIHIGKSAFRFITDEAYYPTYKIDMVSLNHPYSCWEHTDEPPSCFDELLKEAIYKRTIKVIRQ